MANSLQAIKRSRQTIKRRKLNMSQRSTLRSSIKKLLKLILKKEFNLEKDEYRKAMSKIDKATSKGLHHRNRAARLKRRLNNRIKSMNVE